MKYKRKKKSASRQTLNGRLYFVAAFFLLLFLFVAASLVRMQILDYETYAEKAQKQRIVQRTIPARRGEILASDGLPVAQNVTFNLIYAVPWMIENPSETTGKLASLLETDERELFDNLTKDSSYVPLRHWASDELAGQVADLKLRGIVITPEEKRYYPEQTMLSHVLGYVNRDGDGQYGLEEYYNSLLKGKEGYLKREQDTSGRAIPIGLNEEVPTIDGANLILTIDRSVQRIVEEKLKDGIVRTASTGGNVIVMDPMSGAILAMANYPVFDPNDYSAVLLDEEGNLIEEGYNIYNNDSVSSQYEPGSIFKVVTMAMALDSGKYTSASIVNDPGEYTPPSSTSIVIKNWDGLAHGNLTLTRCLELSNNVCLAQIGVGCGSEIFYRYIQGFGFGQTTSIDLAAEASGNIQNFDNWNDIQAASTAFGQSVSVTPIQMAVAVSTVANRGRLVRPYIVQEILQEDQVIEQETQVIKQVISAATAEELTHMMVNVVERGGGKRAAVPGYHIAGKTGTAQVAKKEESGYEDNIFKVSFVGYAPADAPKFVIFVKLDLSEQTHPDLRWGSEASGPIFREIAKELFKYYEIPPVGV